MTRLGAGSGRTATSGRNAFRRFGRTSQSYESLASWLSSLLVRQTLGDTQRRALEGIRNHRTGRSVAVERVLRIAAVAEMTADRLADVLPVVVGVEHVLPA